VAVKKGQMVYKDQPVQEVIEVILGYREWLVLMDKKGLMVQMVSTGRMEILERPDQKVLAGRMVIKEILDQPDQKEIEEIQECHLIKCGDNLIKQLKMLLFQKAILPLGITRFKI
jgi:hypothetical protein